MKGLDKDNQKIEELKIVTEKHDSEERFVTSIKFHAGQKVWKYHLVDKKLTEVKPVTAMLEDRILPGAQQMKKETIRYKVEVEPKCIYTAAINERNAMRKFKKMVENLLRQHRSKQN